MASYRQLAEHGFDLHTERCDVFFYTRLFLRCPATLQALTQRVREDQFFPDYGAVVWRGSDARGKLWEIAAKAGHNAEHHNHNDCGSFIVSLDGQPAIIEIGAPEYVGDYFSSDKTRYEFLAARSLGHSVPLVNGIEQQPGAQFAAKVLECTVNADVVRFVVDLTNCYPAEAKCRQLVRTFVFEKNRGRLRVSDAFELEAPGVVESKIICHPPTTSGASSATIEFTGGALRISSREKAVFAGTEPCSYRTREQRTASIDRLTFGASEAVKAGAIGFDIEAL